MVVATGDGTMHPWSVAAGRRGAVLPRTGTATVDDFASAPDASLLVAVGRDGYFRY